MNEDLLKLRQEKEHQFKKLVAAFRYRVQGMAMFEKSWYDVLRALEFAMSHHKGYRRDKVTPAFTHQIQIANHIMTMMPHLMFPVRTIIAILLHDTPEDTNVSHEEIRDLFGADTMNDVELLTKEYRGKKKEPEEYFMSLAMNPVSSVGKGGDRVNNQHSMAGVFKLEKQIEYCNETETWFFKFLKEARRRFPQQELIYENLKFTLQTQLNIFRSIHAQGHAA